MQPPIVNTLVHKEVFVDRIYMCCTISDNFLLCVCVGLGVHLLITWAVTNRPLRYVSQGKCFSKYLWLSTVIFEFTYSAATPGWLQNVVSDLSHR